MPLSELSVSTQNYLKEIWSLEEWTKTPATASALAERMGLRISSVSDGLKRLAAADLIGIPWQILVGPKGLAEGKLEVKRRSDGSRENLSPVEVVAKIAG